MVTFVYKPVYSKFMSLSNDFSRTYSETPAPRTHRYLRVQKQVQLCKIHKIILCYFVTISTKEIVSCLLTERVIGKLHLHFLNRSKQRSSVCSLPLAVNLVCWQTNQLSACSRFWLEWCSSSNRFSRAEQGLPSLMSVWLQNERVWGQPQIGKHEMGMTQASWLRVTISCAYWNSVYDSVFHWALNTYPVNTLCKTSGVLETQDRCLHGSSHDPCCLL